MDVNMKNTLLLWTSKLSPKWTSMFRPFWTDESRFIWTYIGRPNEVHSGRPLVRFGPCMDVQMPSACPLGSSWVGQKPAQRGQNKHSQNKKTTVSIAGFKLNSDKILLVLAVTTFEGFLDF